jgi:hypothetical protein
VSTESSPGYSPAYADEPAAGSSTAQVAKDQAAGVVGSAGSAGQHVASVARDEVGQVAAEAKGQVTNVLDQARTELTQQASDQQQRVAGGLRSLGTELGSMADGSQEAGLATDLARQAADRAHEVAEWLEQRDPSSLLGEVKTFARRRPGTFLALALVAGVAAGRLTRGLKDESSTGTGTPAAPPAAADRHDRPGADSDDLPGTGPYAPVAGRVPEPVAETPVFTGNSAFADDPAYADPPTFTADSPVHTDEPAVEKTTYTGGERR